MDVRGECRDYQTVPGIFHEYTLKGGAYRALRGGVAVTLRIRGLAEEQLHALLAELAYSCEVHYLPVYRGDVYLEVSGMVNNTDGCSYRYRAGVGYRVVDVYKLRGENPEVHDVARLNRKEPRLMLRLVLLELSAENTEGQARAVHRDVQLL